MAETRINFGEWLPDQPGVSGALTEATNVYPIASGYAPNSTAVDYSNDAGEVLNVTAAAKSGGNPVIFAGSLSKLYKFNSTTLDLDDVSPTGGYSTPSGSRWNFAQFGSVLLAANNDAKIQYWDLNSSTEWDDVSPDAPIAKFVTVVRDFVVSAHINGNTNSNRVQWSDINDETDWVSGPTSQADFQDLADGGDIRGITGGEFGLVLSERTIHRMSYVGSPFFFQFDAISRGLGCLEGNSVAQYKGLTYFLSDDGFYVCDGQNVTAIGAEKVDRFFFNDIDINNISGMSAAIDPIRALVVWCYKNVSGNNSLLIYNWQLQRWTYGITVADTIASSLSTGVSLEGLDDYGTVDSILTSWDDRIWAGGDLLFAGTSGQKIVTFTGPSATATITTGDIGGEQGLFISMVRPIVDNGSANISVAARNTLDAPILFGTPQPTNSDGRSPQRARGRYHRIKVTPTGNWSTAVGLSVDINSVGTR